MKILSLSKLKWKKVEVKRLVSADAPFVMCQLSSGFRDIEIEVYEDPYGELTVKHVELKEKGTKTGG